MFSNHQIHLEDLPSLNDVVLKPISKRYLNIIVLRRLFMYSIIFSALIGAKLNMLHPEFQELFWYVFLTVALICVLNFGVALLAFNKRKYAIREQDVIYTKGLLINSTSVIPVSRIQHLEISRSWLARKFNLATLKVFTAGESGIDLTIAGLEYELAQQINDFLSAKVNETD